MLQPREECTFREQDFKNVRELRIALRNATKWGQCSASENGSTVYVFEYRLSRQLVTQLPGKGSRLLDHLGLQDCAIRSWYEQLLISNEGSTHSRMRSAIAKRFTAWSLRQYTEIANTIIRAALQGLIAKREGDLVDMMRYVPIRLMSRILGVPDEDVFRLLPYVEDIESLSRKTAQELTRAESSLSSLLQYFERLLECKRSHPSNDLISSIALDCDGRLTQAEMIAFATNMLAISHEPLLSQICCSLYSLLQQSNEFLTAEISHGRIHHVVEESIRLEPSIDYADRIVVEPIEIGGIIRKPGTLILCSLAAANRDPLAWNDPENFMPTRFLRATCPRVLTFGGGIHHCLGSALVRLTISEIVRCLFINFSPSLKVPPEQLEWMSTLASRPTTLPVVVAAT